MKKSFFAGLLALCIVLGMLPAALAVEATEAHDAYIDTNDSGTYDDGETKYETLAAAIAAAEADQTVTLLKDVTLTETLTIPAGKTVTLNLNGKTVDVVYVEGSTTNHIYAFTNNGILTITGAGFINTRGIFNYGNLTVENGTINAIDGNGGYGVRNYAGAVFTMNGGTIATTLEDDNKVNKGGYDATTVRVDEDATFTMNGGELKNICDYTFAIDNYGTTTVKAGKISSVHTTVANYGTMTIEGGEFTCNGLEGITAHAVWAAEGTTTIKGGTFNGKDNYNGFNVDASEGATVYITGGNFLSVHSGSLYGDGTIIVSGGTFFDNPTSRLAPGCVATKSGSTWTVGVPKPVAQVGDTKYTTVAEAISKAEDGGTVYLLPGTITEYVNPWGDSTHASEKSITIIGAENYGTTMTGGMYLGYDDSQTRDHTITIKGISFQNKGLTVFDQKNVAVEGNKFSNITGSAILVSDLDRNGANGSVIIRNNLIENTSDAGIEVRRGYDATITGNSIANTNSNGILLSGSFTGTADVSENIISNWGLADNDNPADGKLDGRALRVVLSGGTITAIKNVMTHDTAPEEFVKVTGNGTVDLSGNYWNGADPAGNVKTDVPYFTANSATLKNYYTDSAKTTLVACGVAAIGNDGYATLADAIAAAEAGDTVTLLGNITGTETIAVDKSITLDLNGNTIENAGSGWVLKVNGNSIMTLTDNSTEADGTITGVKGINVVQGSELVMNGGNIAVTGATGAAIQVYGSEATMNGGTITAEYGAILIYSNNDVRGIFTMNGGEMKTKSVTIFANGSEAWDNVDVTVNGGNITSTEAPAIYWPAAGKLTITGGELTGPVAVYVKSGSLEITDGDFVAHGEQSDYYYVSSGIHLTGDALVIENVGGESGYEATFPVSVTGGTFTSAEANAVASYAAEGATALTGFITGGTFSSDPSDYVAEGKKAAQNSESKYIIIPADSYLVTFDPNEGQFAEIPNPTAPYTIFTHELGGALMTRPAREGYTFAGWFTAVEGGTKVAAVSEIIESTTLYAQWIVEHTVTFNTNGGNAIDGQTVAHGTELTLPTPTHSDYYYVFTGWKDEGGTTYNAGSSYTVTGDVTFTAQWYDTYVYIPPTPVTPPTTTEKTENEDGSTTTTVTDNKTGTVTETTENTDGSTTTVETKKDGTVTEKVENTDGSTQVTETKSETTTNKDGSTTTTTATKTESTDASGATVTEVTETKAETTVKEDGTTETVTNSTTTATDAEGKVTTSTTTATETTATKEDGSTVTEKVEETVAENAEEKVETKTTATTTATEEKTETVAVTEQTVTKADGTTETKTTTTTETALADGTTGTAVTDETGKTEATVSLSQEAAASEEPVALPIPAVTTTTDSEAASTITVTTNSETATAVAIPVADVSASTVAVIVNADGTETVITETKMTDEGLVIDVPDGATVKIVDNSADFNDVTDENWENDAVNFASARGLVSGVGNDTFDLDGITTRAHVVTLLARMAGVDTTPDEGEEWYEKGHKWAVENGITYEGSMSVAVSRQSMFTMIWRMLGCPASDHDIGHFTDTDGLTQHTQEAARWATEVGLIQGNGDGTMDPTGTVTRGQLAQFMMNFIQKT